MTWKALFKRALCIFFYCGHDNKASNEHSFVVTCQRCGENFWNKEKIIHKHRKIRHNIRGKRFY